MIAPMKLTSVFALLLIAGCPHHSASPGTQHGNELILGAMGIPEFSTSANRCPSQNGEGKI